MDQIEVVPVGTEVEIVHLDNVGFITGIYIRENDHITYDVAVWDGKSRSCYNLSHFEIKPKVNTKKIKIGYKGV